MKTIGNIIWLLFGGLLCAVEYFIASIPLLISIIGIPFGIQTIKLGTLAIWPFGAQIKIKKGNPGCISTLFNIIWFLIGGIWICLTHLIFGMLFAITIIGLLFANQHFKLASLALTPFGREVIR